MAQFEGKAYIVLRPQKFQLVAAGADHGLRTPGEEITFTARPKIKSQSQIFRYGRSIGPNFWISLIYDFTGCL